MERMLGTALVLASLDKGYLLCKSSLKILVQRAENAPWVTRPDRCDPSLLLVGANLKTTATAEVSIVWGLPQVLFTGQRWLIRELLARARGVVVQGLFMAHGCVQGADGWCEGRCDVGEHSRVADLAHATGGGQLDNHPCARQCVACRRAIGRPD